MPALSNQKHERFAQAMSLEGAEQRKAYLAAGFHAKTDNAANASASKLIRKPTVAARIAELRTDRVENLALEVQALVGPLDDGVFTRVGRAKKQAEIRRKIHQLIEERAKAPEHQAIPGGKTGLVVIKGVKKQNGQDVLVSAADTKLISSLLSVDEQIARELGQWVEKRDDTLEIRHLDDLSDETLAELIKDAEEIQEREAKLKNLQAPPQSIELHRVDPGDEEPTGAGDPVVLYKP